jgi:hypothetical protein
MIVPVVFPPPLSDHCGNRLNRLPLIAFAQRPSVGRREVDPRDCPPSGHHVAPPRGHGYDLMLTLPAAVAGGNLAREGRTNRSGAGSIVRRAALG